MDVLEARKYIDKIMVLCSLVFAVLSIGLMICFKWQEPYFDAHGRISVQAEAARENSEINKTIIYNRRQINVELENRAESKLVIPISDKITQDIISVQDEFVHNKLYIKLCDSGSCLASNAVIVMDDRYLEDVSVYKQKGNTIIEASVRDNYYYIVDYQQGELVVHFGDVREQYDSIVVVYVPYDELQGVFLSEWTQVWQKSLQDYAVKHNMKLYMTYEQQEIYSEADVAAFAQRVHADMLLGIRTDKESEKANIETACNTVYFIPEFGNLELAIALQEEFLNVFKYATTGIRESSKEDELLYLSTVPTALVTISEPLLAQEKAEDEYAVNQNISTALLNVLKRVVSSYYKGETYVN